MKFTAAALALSAIVAKAMVAPGTDEPTQPPKPPATAPPTAPPTMNPADVVHAVSFTDYPRDQSCNTGNAVKTSTCFSSGGKSYRFGCKAGSNRVLTDECDAGCNNCENNWVHEGELTNTCYDDGSYLFSYTCSAPGSEDGSTTTPGKPSVPTTPDPGTPTAETGRMSCSQLGWETAGGSNKVCGASRVDPNTMDTCPGMVSFYTAESLCKAAGGRLCTSAELSNDETVGTGCKADMKRVWSSTPCDNGAGVFTQAGARKGLKDAPIACTSKTAKDTTARCCSDEKIDVGQDVAPVGQGGYPSGFGPALSYDYANRDGSCRISTPVSISSCWTDKNGKSYRFACAKDETGIYKQACGRDNQCDPSNCSGEWYSDMEVSGKCYSSSTTYYEYKCSL